MSTERGAKAIFIGSISVGKTTLMTRLTENRFDPETHPTSAAAFCQWKPDFMDDLVIQFWDTSGMEKYRSINQIYYREASAALLVFDLTEKRTFEDLGMWKQDFEKENSLSGAIIILVGNKCDLAQDVEVSEEEARSWADDHGMQYFEVSAMTGEGIVELLDGLVRTIPRKAPRPQSVSLKPGNVEDNAEKQSCC
jgi:small GTP-binding protein